MPFETPTAGQEPEQEIHEQEEESVPNYRRPFTQSETPNFRGPNFEKRAETIVSTIREVEQLITSTENHLESVYRNSFLQMLIGMKSALMDEYNRLAHPEQYDDMDNDPHNSNYGVGSTKLHPATQAALEEALASWGLEIKERPQ